MIYKSNISDTQYLTDEDCFKVVERNKHKLLGYKLGYNNAGKGSLYSEYFWDEETKCCYESGLSCTNFLAAFFNVGEICTNPKAISYVLFKRPELNKEALHEECNFCKHKRWQECNNWDYIFWIGNGTCKITSYVEPKN